MIRCKLIEYRSPDATQAVTRVGRAVTGETLPIGRAASSRIYLPDPRVRLEHASIQRAEDGHLYLEAFGPVLVDQRAATPLRLRPGLRLSIGPYELMVEELEDGPASNPARLTLSFALRPQGDPGAVDPDDNGRHGLRAGRLTRRRLSWLLVLAVGLVGLALPLRQAVDARPAAPPTSGGGAPAAAAFDTLWNPGPISSAHRNVAEDCRACHGVAFARVADADCTRCHDRVGEHVADPRIRASAFGAPRCAGCHREHQGAAGMRVVHSAGCEECHAAIATQAPESRLVPISDFADKHPDFRLSIRRAIKPPQIERVLQTATLQADPGLRYPHDVHLDPKGVKSPTGPAATGGRVVLDCDDCHVPDGTGVGFRPVEMARHCQACHRLAIDLQAPDRQIDHGDVERARAGVREVYAALAIERFPVEVITVNRLLQRPAAPVPARIARDAADWVEEQSARAFVALFEKEQGVCTTCHVVGRELGHDLNREANPTAIDAARVDGAAMPPTYRIRPIVDTRRWMPASRFEHATHAAAECGRCHAAARSKSAADILIPDIDRCRECHAGARAARDRVPSRCDACHGFHGDTEHPAFAAKVEGKPR